MDFKESCCTHAAANAHCNDTAFGLTALTFNEHVAGHTGAAHAKRMTDRDRAAVDIEPVMRNSEPVAAVECLAREGFIEFPEVDVRHLETLFLKKLRHRKHRTDSHFIRLTSRDGK